MNTFTTSILQPLKDFLFLTACFHCGSQLKDGDHKICAQCWNSLSVVGDHDYTLKVLRERFTAGGVIDDCISLYYFEKGKLLQSLTHSLKYDEITFFGVTLGETLAKKLQKNKIDYCIPIPLNKRKERERGYNQSDFIAMGISNVLGAPVLKNVIQRKRYTVTQTHLNAEERKKNIAEAFSISTPELIKGKNILLIDDIITTGSTIQEAAKLVKKSGAGSIVAASIGLAKLGEDT